MTFLQERIHDMVEHYNDKHNNVDPKSLAENIGFLIRVRFRTLDLDDVFIPMAVPRDSQGSVTRSRIAVVVYSENSSCFLTIVSVQVDEADLIEELEKKVDAMVFRAIKD